MKWWIRGPRRGRRIVGEMEAEAPATRVDKWPAFAGLLFRLSYAAVVATAGLEPATDTCDVHLVRHSPEHPQDDSARGDKGFASASLSAPEDSNPA